MAHNLAVVVELPSVGFGDWLLVGSDSMRKHQGKRLKQSNRRGHFFGFKGDRDMRMGKGIPDVTEKIEIVLGGLAVDPQRSTHGYSLAKGL